MARQSFNQRFTAEALDFVKSLVEQQCRNQITDESLNGKILNYWNNVYLHDSTQFALPEHMRDYFKGYGGAAKSESVVKIQHGYELRSGKLHIHQLGDAYSQDVTSGKQTLGSYKHGDLLLRDLGYFDLKSFKLLSQDDQADYVSRLKPKTSIYEPDGEKLDLARLAQQMRKGHIPFIDKQVIIGIKNKTQVRVIITLAPDEVVRKRIRKTNAHNKSKGCQTSDDFKQYAAFNIYITNVDPDKLSAGQIMKLYRLRWQIELLFKTWKSYYKIHCIKTCNYYRTLCYLYASLLMIQINWEISAFIQVTGYHRLKQSMSILKLMKACLQYKADQRKWPGQPQEQVIGELWEMFRILLKNTVREKRKKRYNYQDILDSIVCKSDN